jgi:hypothetical protein
MLMSLQQNAGQNHNMETADRSFENLGMTVRNQNYIHEEVKSRLNFWNACYHSAQNLLSSHPLFIYVMIKIYKICIVLLLF